MPSFTPGSTSESVKEKFKEASELDVPGPSLGVVNRATLARDPKHLGFTLARYKFISKMFESKYTSFNEKVRNEIAENCKEVPSIDNYPKLLIQENPFSLF